MVDDNDSPSLSSKQRIHERVEQFIEAWKHYLQHSEEGDERPDIAKVAAALQFAYRQKIVHREIKPTNIAHPAECVNWYDAIMFCNWLSLHEDLPACYELEMKAIEQGWTISEEQRERIVEHWIAIAASKAGDASPRDRIRVTECLAKLDALNIQREQADRTKRVDIAILPPAYEHMTNQANQEMVAYLQQVAISEDKAEVRSASFPLTGCLPWAFGGNQTLCRRSIQGREFMRIARPGKIVLTVIAVWFRPCPRNRSLLLPRPARCTSR